MKFVRIIGGKHPCHARQQSPVGASLLAMIVNDNAGDLNQRGGFTPLAPTGDRVPNERGKNAWLVGAFPSNPL
ncbi:hypothetical protein EMIT0P100_80202 [Pseudomonas sp. IT-P100]